MTANIISCHFINLVLLISSSPTVDEIRRSLEEKSDRWFFWLVVSSIIVAAGVALEAPEATIALKKWFLHWRGKEVAPDNEKSLVIPAAYLGLLLVIIGVVGEGVFEALGSRAETSLRAHDEQILTDALIRAGNAKDSAEGAAKAAGQAEGASGKAIVSASNALIVAGGARKEADSFEKDIVSAKQQAADANSHLAEALRQASDAKEELNRLKAPRMLNDISAVITALQPFKGTKYRFMGAFEDKESTELLRQIDSALELAGWVRESSPSATLIITINNDLKVPPVIANGVAVEAESSESLNVLRNSREQTLPEYLRAGIALKRALFSAISPSQNELSEPLNVHPGDSTTIGITIGKKL